MKQLSIHTRLIALLGSNKWLLVGPFGVGVVLNAFLLAQAAVTSQIFVQLFAQPVGPITGWLIALAVLLLIRPVLMILREWVSIAVLTRVKNDLRHRVLSQLTARGPVPLARERTGHVTALVVDGVENLDAYYARYIPQLGVVAVNTLIVVTVLALVEPVVAAAVGVCAVLVPVLPRLWDKVLERRGASHWQAYSSLHADFVDSLQAMPTIKAIGAVHRRQRDLANASQSLLAATMNQLKVSLVESGISAFALVFGPFIAVVVSLARVNAGALEPTQVFLIGLLTIELFRPFRELSNHWHAGYMGTFAGQQIEKALAAPTPDTPENPERITTEGPGTCITVENVIYRYPDAETAALKDLSLHVSPGERIGMVGPSGSGKSTIAALLSRFALPDTGQVRIAGVPTTDTDQRSCIDVVSVVPQSPVLFHGTLRENLLEAVPGASEDDLVEVIEATGLSQLAPDQRPQQVLDRDIGERGSLLSGGQRQRVAIARAMLRRTPVMVLDEATSALDRHSERELLEMLDDRLPGQTRIVIAHRLAAIRDLDRIAVVEAGQVAETGTHFELLTAGGRYAQLLHQQHTALDTLPTGAAEASPSPADRAAAGPAATEGRTP